MRSPTLTQTARAIYLVLACLVAVPVQAQDNIPTGFFAAPTGEFFPDSSEAERHGLQGRDLALHADGQPILLPDPASKARFIEWMGQDASAFVGGASLKTLGYAAGTMAFLAPLSVWDDDVSPVVKRQADGSFGGFLGVVNELGGPKAIAVPASAFAISLMTDDERFQNAAFTSLQSLLYAGVASYAIKYAVGRSRPHQLEGTHRFTPFSGNASFPSGHTTTAFAIVTPWVMFYPHPITYGLFALSTGTAVARIARDAHWTTDVMAGAALGFTTGYWLSRRHGALSDNFDVTPILAPNNVGLALKATF